MAHPQSVKHEDALKTYQHRAAPGVVQSPANEVVSLQFNGVGIHERGEMISLTDMWKAAGSPDSRRPADWRDREGRQFIEAVAMANNAATSGIFVASRGRYGQTFGHWQAALGYAQYLSPEFHMWCNTVVRERMEMMAGRAIVQIDPATMELVRRIDGISRMLSHKVTEIEKAVGLVYSVDQTVMQLVEKRFAELTMASVHDLTAGKVIVMAGVTDMKGLRRLPRRVSDRLRQIHAEQGVAVRQASLGKTKAYVFDERVCREWLLSGGKEAIAMWVQEMRGQHVLKLVVSKQSGGE